MALLLGMISQFVAAQTTPNIQTKTPLTIGETVVFHSDILNQDRTLNIYLPLGYSDSIAKDYPVIYLLDGSIDEDIIHIAGLVQFGSFSWINLVQESIVVGIANIDRKHDFTFPSTVKQDQEEFPTTGGSAHFIEFIAKELQPLVQANYRTTAHKTLIGQSLGGLLATEILFKKPDLFTDYMIVSPSLWWDAESLLKESTVAYSGSKTICIAVGKEGAIMERTARQLHEKLKTVEHPRTRLRFKFFEAQDHGDALHRAVYWGFEQMKEG